jgi:hypothetical protein
VALVLMMCGVISWIYGRQILALIRNIDFWENEISLRDVALCLV